jgi:hypothetical protein
MLKPVKLLIVTLLFFSSSAIFNVYAQNNNRRTPTAQLNSLKGFISYIKNKEFQNISQRKIFRKYISAHHILNDTSQKQVNKKIFEYILKKFSQIADTIKIEDWEFIPWNSYTFVKGAPRMVWEAEPVTHIFGEEVNQNLDVEKEVQEGRKELERTIVIVRRNKPEVPLYYILFDESNKIASWVLINQGGLHYWIYF